MQKIKITFFPTLALLLPIANRNTVDSAYKGHSAIAYLCSGPFKLFKRHIKKIGYNRPSIDKFKFNLI